MFPRFQAFFLALMVALLIILGTLGIYSAEASSFRTTMRDVQAFDQSATTDAYDFGTSDTFMVSSPGLPY
jgi:hypothetical protein